MNNATNTFSVAFILRKDKAKDEMAPIALRIFVEGKKAEITIKRRIPIDKWGGAKKVLGNSPETKEFNRHLEKLYSKAYQIYEKLFAVFLYLEHKSLQPNQSVYALSHLPMQCIYPMATIVIPLR